MNKKTIKFVAQNKHVLEVRQKPIPAKNIHPEWWKNIPVYSNKESKLRLNPHPNVTVKRCFPTLDIISMGYVFTLWCDLEVTIDKHGSHFVRWLVNEPPVSTWTSSQVEGFEIPIGYQSNPVFKYHHGWTIKTPKNFSCLITHPFGYQNLPIKSISGVVDTDEYDGEINVPFVFKEGWSGILPVGTPMFQVIPFERHHWESEILLKQPGEHTIDVDKMEKIINSAYGKLFHRKKKYT